MAIIEQSIQDIIDRAAQGKAATKEECVQMLSLDPTSAEAFAIRAAASTLVRAKTGNTGVLFAQIGVECSPCEADCSFCSFGASHTALEPFVMDDDTIVEKALDFCQDGDLYGLWLMAMHAYDLEHYLHVVRLVRETVPETTHLYSNVGDTDYDAFVAMKEAGIDGVYHICRIGEGTVTKIRPAQRLETMRNAQRAGLPLLNAVEPIGPEHTPEELAEEIFTMKSFNPIQTGSMKRIAVPGTPFENSGEINHFKLSQIVSVQCLALMDLDPLPWIGIHEPCEAGYLSGANLITAETGVNPRDTAADTSQSRGMDLDACRRALYESGFTRIARGDGTYVDLTPEYIESKRLQR